MATKRQVDAVIKAAEKIVADKGWKKTFFSKTRKVCVFCGKDANGKGVCCGTYKGIADAVYCEACGGSVPVGEKCDCGA